MRRRGRPRHAAATALGLVLSLALALFGWFRPDESNATAAARIDSRRLGVAQGQRWSRGSDTRLPRKDLVYKYDLCLMARNFNQASRLAPEWLLYHKLLGFDQFFIVDDCSTDSSLHILNRFKSLGLVTLYTEGFRGSCEDYIPDVYFTMYMLYNSTRPH